MEIVLRQIPRNLQMPTATWSVYCHMPCYTFAIFWLLEVLISHPDFTHVDAHRLRESGRFILKTSYHLTLQPSMNSWMYMAMLRFDVVVSDFNIASYLSAGSHDSSLVILYKESVGNLSIAGGRLCLLDLFCLRTSFNLSHPLLTHTEHTPLK